MGMETMEMDQMGMMGAQQTQIPPGDLPTNFKEDVRTAICHELDDAAFYQNIAYRATTRHVQMHFMHASHDEQRLFSFPDATPSSPPSITFSLVSIVTNLLSLKRFMVYKN